MKKLFALIVAMLMILTFVACDSSEEEPLGTPDEIIVPEGAVVYTGVIGFAQAEIIFFEGKATVVSCQVDEFTSPRLAARNPIAQRALFFAAKATWSPGFKPTSLKIACKR